MNKNIKSSDKRHKKDFGKEILETMSYKEAKDFLSLLMETRIEKKKNLDKLHKRIVRITKKYHAPDTVEFDICVDSLWILYGLNEDVKNQKELDTLERHYRWNEARKPQFSNMSTPRPDYTLMIQEAKQTPLESLCNNPLRRSGSNRLSGLCPFHQERRASFTIYIEANTYFCFGCGAKGDSIAFYQKLYGVSFWEAVKQLSGLY